MYPAVLSGVEHKAVKREAVPLKASFFVNAVARPYVGRP